MNTPERSTSLPHFTVAACALAGMDVLLRRVALRFANASGVSHGDAFWLSRISAFLMNSAAVFGLFVLFAAMIQLADRRNGTSGAFRFAISGFAGIFGPTMVLTTLLPEERMTWLMVLILAGTSAFFAITIGLFAFDRSALARVRGPAVAIAVSAMAAFAASIMTLVARISQSLEWAARAEHARTAGEVVWLFTLAFLIWQARPFSRSRRLPLLVGIAAFAGILLNAAYLAQQRFPELTDAVAYGATKLAWLTSVYKAAPFVVLVLGYAFAWLTGTTSRSLPHTLGLPIAMWIAAGYAPSTPLTLLFQTLAIALLAVAAVVRTERLASDHVPTV